MTSAAVPARFSERHLPALDGLRGIAVIIVTLVHSNLLTPDAAGIDGVWFQVAAAGWTGVDLFFVLSGFLITGILYDAKGSPHYFRNFYARRFLRIVPVYYGFLLAFCVIAPRLQFVDFPVPEDYARWPLSFWLYLSNYSMAFAHEFKTPELAVFWTLAVEEQFYLTWPLVVWMLPRRKLIVTCAVVIVMSLGLRIVLAAYGFHWMLNYALTPARVDTLASGALVALLVRGPQPSRFLGRGVRYAALAIGLAAVIVPAYQAAGLYFWTPPVQTAGFSGVALVSAVLIATVVMRPSGIAARLLSIPALRSVGRYSYAMYVFHVFVVYRLSNARVFSPDNLLTIGGSKLPGQILVHAAVFTVTFAMAWVSWHAYEKHFLKLKVFFPRHARQRSPAAGAPEALATSRTPVA
jgi:peptidoglycan/LPS O-acetylase OafA/YrhL